MKKFTRTFLLVSMIVCAAQIAFACSFTPIPLRKKFRAASNVVIAQVLEISDAPKNHDKSNNSRVYGTIRLKILKSWKGSKQTEISLLSDVGCVKACDTLRFFEKGKQYLLFTEKNYVSYCGSEDAEDYFTKKGKINRLDNFLFRAWARIYPF